MTKEITFSRKKVGITPVCFGRNYPCKLQMIVSPAPAFKKNTVSVAETSTQDLKGLSVLLYCRHPFQTNEFMFVNL